MWQFRETGANPVQSRCGKHYVYDSKADAQTSDVNMLSSTNPLDVCFREGRWLKCKSEYLLPHEHV